MIKEKLKEIREQTGMNKKEFANSIGIKYTTYNGYETGTREPSSDFLILISEKFDISIDYIMGVSKQIERLHSYQLKLIEYEFINKYRNLDKHGKMIVDFILNEEYNRIVNETNFISLLYFPQLISLSISSVSDNVSDFINIPLKNVSQKADYVVNVNNLDMKPTYCMGDKIFIQKCSSINIGEVGLFTLNRSCFIRRLEKDNLLVADNNEVDSMILTDEVTCIGKVLGKLE